MNNIWNYILALLVIAVIRWLIPKFGKLVNWLIVKFVKLAERTIKGSKLGKKKKQFVLKCLKVFGVKASNAISELIDLTVDTLNSKQTDTIDSIKSDISNGINETIDKVTNK